MGKKLFLAGFVTLVLFCYAYPGLAAPAKISIFNFRPLNIEASALSTTVTNMLITALSSEASLSLLERKDLEAFLSLNDLQQNDNVDNVQTVGARLGLDAIVVGTIDKKGSILFINCRVINIEQKRAVSSHQVRSLGDARLASEIGDLAKQVTASIGKMAAKVEAQAVFSGPVKMQTRPGNKRIQLNWEDAAGTKALAYEVFRATSENGPYARLGQVTVPEFIDQTVENKVAYYYKVRAYNEKGMPSEYSGIVSAESALTPNPPVIIKAESHIKSIKLTWTPSPMASQDPQPLRGYKLYQAKQEQGPYKEVVSVVGKDLGIGIDTASTLDKLFNVTYTDKNLLDGESYYYKVTAHNDKNLESEFSSPLRASTLPAIKDVTAQGDMIREIRLSWMPIKSPDVKGYNVYRSDKEDGAFKRISRIDVSSSDDKRIGYRDTEGLGDLVRYFYRVTAFEFPDLETSPATTVSAQTKGKPPTPQEVKAIGGLVKKVELRWTASAADDVEGYNIYSSQSSEGEFVLIKRVEGRNNSRYVDEGRSYSNKLDDNATYYYRVTCYNKVNVESTSVLASATTKPRPSRPQAPKGEAGKVKVIPLSWPKNPEEDIVYYHLFRNIPSEGKEFTSIARIRGNTAHTDKDLKDGVAYRYAIQAEDRDGLLSDFSEAVVVSTKPRPRNPQNLSGEILGGMIQLNWEGGSEPDIASYIVYEKRFLGFEKIATVRERSFGEQAPPKGKSKTYVVTAIDKDGLESEPSKEITVTVKQ